MALGTEYSWSFNVPNLNIVKTKLCPTATQYLVA